MPRSAQSCVTTELMTHDAQKTPQSNFMLMYTLVLVFLLQATESAIFAFLAETKVS